jgi:glycosyltransferase involved in cell wall biosynthesis
MSGAKKIKVVHHERCAGAGHFSIERLFREVRIHLPADIEVETVRCPFPSKGFLPRWRNVRHAGRQVADVHHIVGDSHYLAPGLPGKRTVLTIHDCAAFDRLRGWRRAVLKYFWFTGPMRRAAVVTTISEASREELRKWVGPLANKLTVVPDCVFSDLRYAPKSFNEKAPVVLQVGTKENKNLERVAEAIATTNCQLHVVGDMDGNQRNRCKDLGIPFCVFGVLSDEALVQAFRRADIVVFASLYEGFGLPILEAQAIGRPVITSNISSLPEAAGDGALLVDPLSVDEIRAAIVRIINDAALRTSLVEKGLKNIERFRPEAVASRYAEIYRQIAGAD